MKKRTKVILGVVIGVLVLYSAFMTIGVFVTAREYAREYNELSAKYDEAKAKNAETVGKEVSTKINSVMFESFAKTIDENAIINVIPGECAIIKMNMGEKSFETVMAETTKNVTDLALGIKYAEVKTCILLFADKQGDVAYGITLHSDGSTTSFIRNK